MRFPIVCAIILLFAFSSSCWALTKHQVEAVEQLKKDVEGLFSKGRYKEAIPLIEKIIKIDEDDKTASYLLTVAKRQLVEPFCRKADEAYMKNDYHGAINEWRRILDIYPQDMRVAKMIRITSVFVQDTLVEDLFAEVEAFLAKNDYENAVSELEKILMIKPDDSRARDLLISSRQMMTTGVIGDYYEKALAHMENKNYDLAIDMWNKILSIDKNHEAASRLIAETRRTKLDNMYAEARKSYEKGDYVASRELYNSIMTENPTDAEIKKIISRLNDTLKLVQKIEGQDDFSDMLRRSLANYISLSGNIKAAIAASWYATQLKPESKLAFSIKNFLERKFPTDVMSLESPVRDMNLVDQYLFASLNHIYEGRYDKAIEETSIVLALDPGNILAYKRMGSAYFAMENKEKARETWQKALKLSPNDLELKQFLKLLY